MSHNPHAKTYNIEAYFKDRYPGKKSTSRKDLKNSIRTEFYKVSYWKVWRGNDFENSLVSETHEHVYGVIDA